VPTHLDFRFFLRHSRPPHAPEWFYPATWTLLIAHPPKVVALPYLCSAQSPLPDSTLPLRPQRCRSTLPPRHLWFVIGIAPATTLLLFLLFIASVASNYCCRCHYVLLVIATTPLLVRGCPCHLIFLLLRSLYYLSIELPPLSLPTAQEVLPSSRPKQCFIVFSIKEVVCF